MKINAFLFGLLGLFVYCQSSAVYAHSGSTAYLELTTGDSGVMGAYWIALKDLYAVMDLDLDGDSHIRYGEVKQRADAIAQFAEQHWRATASTGDCAVRWEALTLSRLDDGVYARLPLSITCGAGVELSSLTYTGLFDIDTSHRLIGKINADGEERTFVFSPNKQNYSLQVEGSGLWQTFTTYLEQGVIHILEGYDHLLFLLALLVPIIFAKQKQDDLASGFTYHRQLTVSLLKVITAFTLGHSVTLILASVFAVSPPIAWVETIIAISVVIAGINIVLPIFRESSWRVAAIFGLVHGFGFASVLAELSLAKSAMALSLLSFNLGVEMGQLLVVLVAGPIMVLLARGPYLPWFARYGAAGTAVSIGAVWAFERIPL